MPCLPFSFHAVSSHSLLLSFLLRFLNTRTYSVNHPPSFSVYLHFFSVISHFTMVSYTIYILVTFDIQTQHPTAHTVSPLGNLRGALLLTCPRDNCSHHPVLRFSPIFSIFVIFPLYMDLMPICLTSHPGNSAGSSTLQPMGSC